MANNKSKVVYQIGQHITTIWKYQDGHCYEWHKITGWSRASYDAIMPHFLVLNKTEARKRFPAALKSRQKGL